MMDKKLRELMLEAGYAAPELAGRANKLSELVIEEMYDFIMEEVGNNNGIPDLGKIKEHFGVK